MSSKFIGNIRILLNNIEMPYKLYKIKDGFKVGLADKQKMSNGRYYLSNKPLSKSEALKQKKAVELNEKKQKNP